MSASRRDSRGLFAGADGTACALGSCGRTRSDALCVMGRRRDGAPLRPVLRPLRASGARPVPWMLLLLLLLLLLRLSAPDEQPDADALLCRLARVHSAKSASLQRLRVPAMAEGTGVACTRPAAVPVESSLRDRRESARVGRLSGPLGGMWWRVLLCFSLSSRWQIGRTRPTALSAARGGGERTRPRGVAVALPRPSSWSSFLASSSSRPVRWWMSLTAKRTVWTNASLSAALLAPVPVPVPVPVAPLPATHSTSRVPSGARRPRACTGAGKGDRACVHSAVAVVRVALASSPSASGSTKSP